jgi:DNA-directed RNA polymerase specialized sigma24 family protein
MDRVAVNLLEDRDSELLELLKNNDVKAFDELYHKYFGRVYNLVHIALNDKGKTEDVVAAVFLHLWERRADHEIESLNKYIFAFTCMEILHKRKAVNKTTVNYLPSLVGKKFAEFRLSLGKFKRVLE